jgi:nucleotide-binding universal stress UspA family protein
VSTSVPMAPTDSAADDAARASDGDPPVREVVVGVDGTEVGLNAVRWAAQEAARRDAPLLIVHAAPYLGRSDPTGAPSPELPRARGITAVAYTVARRAQPGVQASTEVVPDEPVDVLLRAAAGGQLLVLGSSATGAADEMVLATVNMRVAARSPAPVVVVPRNRGQVQAGRPVVAILGVGERADDEAVAHFAAAAARREGVPLSLLQTRSPQQNVAASWVDDDDAWAERFPDLQITRSDLPSARANQVLGAASPSPLMVMSAGRGTPLHRPMDGPHRWLIRHCTSPMALLPSVRESEGAPPPG